MKSTPVAVRAGRQGPSGVQKGFPP
jgi:hypothetical protein